jgi:hypothetical protein
MSLPSGPSATCTHHMLSCCVHPCALDIHGDESRQDDARNMHCLLTYRVLCCAPGAAVFALDLVLLADNVRLYQAWRRKVGTYIWTGLDLEQAGGTSAAHARSHIIYATPGAGRNLQLADRATTGGLAGSGPTSSPTPAAAAAVGAPSTGRPVDMTREALRDTMYTRLAVECTWYALFSLAWVVLLVCVWPDPASLPFAMRRLMFCIGMSHLLTMIVTCCMLATRKPGTPDGQRGTTQYEGTTSSVALRGPPGSTGGQLL